VDNSRECPPEFENVNPLLCVLQSLCHAGKNIRNLPHPVVSVPFENFDLKVSPFVGTVNILEGVNRNLAIVQVFGWEKHLAPPFGGVHHCSFRILQHSS